MENAFNEEISQQLAAIFAKRNPKLDRAQADLLATVSVEVASGLEILSLTRDRTFQQQILNSAKEVLSAYLKPYFS